VAGGALVSDDVEVGGVLRGAVVLKEVAKGADLARGDWSTRSSCRRRW
jgi:hypothetical protein